MKKHLALLFALLFLGGALNCAATVTVNNFEEGEVLSYCVPLLRGQCAAGTLDCKSLNETTGEEVPGAARSGRYKVLTHLVEGENSILVTVGSETVRIHLTYRPADTEYLTYVYFLVDKNVDTHYVSNLPEDQDPQFTDPDLWKKKLNTSVLINQSYTADSAYRLGYGHRTFNLAMDGNNVHIQVVTSQYTRSEIIERCSVDGEFDGGRLYDHFVDLLGSDRGGGKRKVIGITNVDKLVGDKVIGGAALGGGLLGMFGSTGLYCWPDSLQNVVEAFSDTYPTKPSMDDSEGRKVSFGQAATTLGAWLHEAGHGFGLPHIEGNTYYGVMARAYAVMNRNYTVVEPPNANRSTPYYFNANEESSWSINEMHRLLTSPFFREQKGELPPNDIKLKMINSRQLRISSENGIAWYGYWPNWQDWILTEWCFPQNLDGSVKEIILNVEDIINTCGKSKTSYADVNVFDIYGNERSITVRPVEDLVKEKFCGFEAEEGYHLGDADGQKGMYARGADGEIREENGNYYLHSFDAYWNGIFFPVWVGDEDNNEHYIDVTMRVRPGFGGLYLDNASFDENMFYIHTDRDGTVSISYSGGYQTWGKVESGWQTWSWRIDVKHKVLAWMSVNGEIKELGVPIKSTYPIAQGFWLKDTTEGGSDFDDIRVSVNYDIPRWTATMAPFKKGKYSSNLVLTNVLGCEGLPFSVGIEEGDFSLSTNKGVLNDTAKVTVTYNGDIREKKYATGVLWVRLNGEEKHLRFGCPCGNKTEGWVLYEFGSDEPSGAICDVNWSLSSGNKLEVAENEGDKFVFKRLVNENFETYDVRTDMIGKGGWYAAYGENKVNGNAIINEDSEGNRYLRLGNTDGFWGVHLGMPEFDEGWCRSYAGRYIRIRCRVCPEGDISKNIGFWDPSIIENQLWYDSGSYRVNSQASDDGHAEFHSTGSIAPGSWAELELIYDAAHVKASDGKYRHVLRQVSINGQKENCRALCGQEQPGDTFTAVRFFQWGSGALCLDDVCIDLVAAVEDEATLDLPYTNEKRLVFTSGSEEGVAPEDVGAFCSLQSPSGVSDSLDLCLIAELKLSSTQKGLFYLTQDVESRQCQSALRVDNGQVRLSMSDLATRPGVVTWKGACGDPIDLNVISSIGADKKYLREVTFAGRSVFLNEEMTGEALSPVDTIDKFRIYSSKDEDRVEISKLRIELGPQIPEPAALLALLALACLVWKRK